MHRLTNKLISECFSMIGNHELKDLDNIVLSYLKERAEWWKENLGDIRFTSNQIIDKAFELEQESGERCKREIDVGSHHRFCGEPKPCPIHDKPQKKPSERIYEICNASKIPYSQAIAVYLDEQVDPSEDK